MHASSAKQRCHFGKFKDKKMTLPQKPVLEFYVCVAIEPVEIRLLFLKKAAFFVDKSNIEDFDTRQWDALASTEFI